LNALKLIFNAQTNDIICKIRFRHLIDKVINSNTFVKPERLLPIEASAKYHSYRVYLQIQEWIGKHVLDPKDWGWKLHQNEYFPLSTDLAAAPEELLKIICCKCKGDCSTRICACRKK
jgi:hypothetical protein